MQSGQANRVPPCPALFILLRLTREVIGMAQTQQLDASSVQSAVGSMTSNLQSQSFGLNGEDAPISPREPWASCLGLKLIF